ncbi:flagellar protein FlgN [Alcaligenaceae bacterium]|nr:flagellar protein FlgN [Alcaligenaceae bacterium]
MNNTVLQLQKCLEEEVALVQTFITVLEAEAQALTEAGTTDALSDSTDQKNHYADQLMMVADKRQLLLTQLGYSDDKAGLDTAANEHASLRLHYQSLLEKAQIADDLNTANGSIIDNFLAHNQQALDTLRTLAGAGNLYDASGRANRGNQGSTRTFKAG